MKSFNRQRRCEKCLSNMVAFRFTPWQHDDLCLVDAMPLANPPPGEHLDVTCSDCGFVWAMETAAAAGMDPERQ